MINTDEAFFITHEKVKEQLKKGGSGFNDISELLLKGEGKSIRTRLGLICSADKQGMVDETITDKLAALELLHLATLVHDDVIDEADIRRGFPSVQAAFGKHGAVIAGDYILTRSLCLLSNCEQEQNKMFLRAVSAVCRGEMLQERSLYDRTLTPLRYLKTVSGKTAALFSVAAAVERHEFATVSLGHKFGIIYQIADDIRDFTGNKSVFGGKPRLSDLKSGVMTLPAIYCLQKDPRLSDEGVLNNIDYGIAKSKEVAHGYYNKLQTLSKRANINRPQDLNIILAKIM